MNKLAVADSGWRRFIYYFIRNTGRFQFQQSDVECLSPSGLQDITSKSEADIKTGKNYHITKRVK